jgi:hypothetical protein
MVLEIIGEPLIKFVGKKVLEKLFERIAKLRNVPYLKMNEGYVANFYYRDSNPPYYRRFILMKVHNSGKMVATGCYATITLEGSGNKEIPLHWVDQPYTVLRDSMLPIDIPPGRTRELDVAFSVYGSYFPFEVLLIDNRKMTGATSTRAYQYKTEEPTKITADPRYVNISSEPVSNKKEPWLEGAWLATHLILSEPKIESEDYLIPNDPPKRYNTVIKVTSNEGVTCKRKIVIISSFLPSGLTYDWRITPLIKYKSP